MHCGMQGIKPIVVPSSIETKFYEVKRETDGSPEGQTRYYHCVFTQPIACHSQSRVERNVINLI